MRALTAAESKFVTIGDIEEGGYKHSSPGDLRKAKQPNHLSLQKQDYAGAFGQRRDLSVPKQRNFQTNQKLSPEKDDLDWVIGSDDLERRIGGDEGR